MSHQSYKALRSVLQLRRRRPVHHPASSPFAGMSRPSAAILHPRRRAASLLMSN